ncbi:MAG: phosphoribosylamine--glycine ligase [Chloroflexi bacterium]|nr:phosphoribosylamine--glycine ligase [Chloroflexota bacterium]
MRVLVIGSGGREHALVWKLRSSPEVTSILAAPGNGGISAAVPTVPVAADDIDGLVRLASENRIDLTIVGPEDTLAAGIVDRFHDAGLRIFGPTRAAARIESSKLWARDLMQRHGIPTDRWASASTPNEARSLVREFGIPVVLKADGLARGRGAVVCSSLEDTEVAINELMGEGAHGPAGHRIVVEEYLEGTELSVFALADGQHVLPLIGARDYKPLLDGDRGPNTGGMGGYAPPAYATPALMDEVRRTILEPTVRALAAEGVPYVGVLYAGLMITRDGPRVLEFNCRWGDPEAELVLPLLKSDLVDLMDACIDGRLDGMTVEWEDDVTCGVVLAAPGYPATPSKGSQIDGLDRTDPGLLVFHGGTRRVEGPDTPIVTNGGRVLTVVARASTLPEARASAYANATRVHFEGVRYRHDLGEIDPSLQQIRAGVMRA